MNDRLKRMRDLLNTSAWDAVNYPNECKLFLMVNFPDATQHEIELVIKQERDYD